MLSPAGWAGQAIKAVYQGIRWVIDNHQKILNMVKSVATGFQRMVEGPVSAVGESVYGLLSSAVPLLLDLAAKQAGIGDLPEALRGIISKLDIRTYRRVQIRYPMQVQVAPKPSRARRAKALSNLRR